MNWYKEAKQGSIVEPWVRAITKKIMEAIKANKRKAIFEFTDLLRTFSGSTRSNLNNSELVWGKFQFDIVRLPEFMHGNWEVYVDATHGFAHYASEPAAMFPMITVHIRTNLSPIPPERYQKLVQDIQYVVRHELEHFMQDKGDYKKWNASRDEYYDSDGKSRGKPDVVGMLPKYRAYYLQPREIQAYVSGFYYKAKKNRVPLKQVMDEELNLIQENLTNHSLYSPLGIDTFMVELRRAWYTEAANRYPTANIQRPIPKDQIDALVARHKQPINEMPQQVA